MELVLKTSDSRERTMGSNPILSAKQAVFAAQKAAKQ